MLTGRQLFLDQGAGACTLAWAQEALNAQQLPRYRTLSLACSAAPESTLRPVGPTCPVHKKGGAAPLRCQVTCTKALPGLGQG